MINNIKAYWKIFDSQIIGMTLSPEFKDLYIKMITYNPDLRPNAEEILNHPWFNEIRGMNVDIKVKIENEVKEVFMKLVDTVKNNTQREIIIANTESEIAYYNRGCEDKNYFDYKIKPKYNDIPLLGINMNNYIKLKGNLDPVKFMNCLVKEIENEDCFIEINKKNKLEFKVIFEEDIDDEEISDEIKEKLKKLGIENELKENDLNNELIIQIKLYQNSDGYILKFVQKGGNRKNYLDKFNSISKSIQNII